MRDIRLGRHALHGHVGTVHVRTDRRTAERGRPVRVRGRAVRQYIRLHAVAEVRHGALFPVRSRRRRILQESGQQLILGCRTFAVYVSSVNPYTKYNIISSLLFGSCSNGGKKLDI